MMSPLLFLVGSTILSQASELNDVDIVLSSNNYDKKYLIDLKSDLTHVATKEQVRIVVAISPQANPFIQRHESALGDNGLRALAATLDCRIQKINDIYILAKRGSTSSLVVANGDFARWISGLAEEQISKLVSGTLKGTEVSSPQFDEAMGSLASAAGMAYVAYSSPSEVTLSAKPALVIRIVSPKPKQLFFSLPPVSGSPDEPEAPKTVTASNAKNSSTDMSFGTGTVLTLDQLRKLYSRDSGKYFRLDPRLASNAYFISGSFSFSEIESLAKLLQEPMDSSSSEPNIESLWQLLQPLWNDLLANQWEPSTIRSGVRTSIGQLKTCNEELRTFLSAVVRDMPDDTPLIVMPAVSWRASMPGRSYTTRVAKSGDSQIPNTGHKYIIVPLR